MALLSKLDVDDSLFDRESFLAELAKTSSRDDLKEFVQTLNRTCTTLKTERMSFINDKYPEVIDAIQILTQVNQVEERFLAVKEDLERISAAVDGVSSDFDCLKTCKETQTDSK